MTEGPPNPQKPGWNERSTSARAAVGEEIVNNTFRRTEESGRHAFITQHILRKIWTGELLADLFAEVQPADMPDLVCIIDSHLKIMSILIVSQWSKWSQFKATFIDPPGRTDADLPLDEAAILSPHLNKIEVQLFVQSQCKFLPASFHELEDREYSAVFQMPFLEKPQLASDKGSYCSVEKVVIVSRQFYDRHGERNLEHKELIRKLCYPNGPQRMLEQERDVFMKLRKALFDESRIMKSLGTINSLGTPHVLSIYFPVAEFDLDDYLFGRKSSHSICQYPVDPAALLREFACLTHALDYLHTGIRLAEGGEQFVCVHHDLKPENILIVAEAGAPVGRWKITDFGLSRLKEAKKAPRDMIISDRVPSVQASLTAPKRSRGTFQPPETDQTGQKVIGPKSDIWSLGCILCLVLVYAHRGVQGVEAFQMQRSRQKRSGASSISCDDDYFYRDDQINPEVLSALEDVARVGVWAQHCVQIIRAMLQLEPSWRPTAKVIEHWLFEAVLFELKKIPKSAPK